MVQETHFVDARGMMCPEPLRLAELAIRNMTSGSQLNIVATDPAAPIDFEAWCLRRRHEFMTCEEEGNGWVIRIRKGTKEESPG